MRVIYYFSPDTKHTEKVNKILNKYNEYEFIEVGKHFILFEKSLRKRIDVPEGSSLISMNNGELEAVWKL